MAINTSEQLKEAPKPSACFRQVFKNFRDATVALLDCPGAPEDEREEVLKMVEALGDEHDGDDAYDGDLARKVLTRVFDLDQSDADAISMNGDDDDETRVINLLDKISRRPNGSRTLDFLVKAADDMRAADDEEMRAARELAGAFAAIEQWKDYIPADVYNPIGEAVTEWVVNDMRFLSDPKMLRAGLPGILREMFAREEEAAS